MVVGGAISHHRLQLLVLILACRWLAISCQNPCYRSVAQCQPLPPASTCLEMPLSYSHTSHNLTENVTSLNDAQVLIRRLKFLRFVPDCWKGLQPLICSVFFPRCENSLVELPSRSLCYSVREKCRVLRSLVEWPEYFNCSSSNFVIDCKKRKPLDNSHAWSSGSCLNQLVLSNVSQLPAVPGCAESCAGFVYTRQHTQQLHRFVHVFSALSFALTLFTVLTFIIDWYTFGKYVANRCIFCINLCLCLSIFGFLVQFLDAELRQTIVCNEDGTRQTPGSGKMSSSCTAVFVLIYYPAMAALSWFVMLAFSWSLTLKQFGQSRGVQERLNSLMSYFHLISWSVPMVLTTIALATTDVVDSDYMYGVCFVGFIGWYYRVGFVLAPTILSCVLGCFFLIRSVLFLLKQRPEQQCGRLVISANVARLSGCAAFTACATIVSLVCHVIEHDYRKQWRSSSDQYVLCMLNSTRLADTVGHPLPLAAASAASSPHASCQPPPAVPLSLLKLHVFCLFGVGIVFSSWTWRRSSVRAWSKFYGRFTGRPEAIEQTGRHMDKHKVIAQAWNKRYELVRNRRISLSFRSSHSDPVGVMNGLGMESSGSPTSSFLAAIPHLLVRRGALVGSTSSALGLNGAGRGDIGSLNGSVYSLYSRASHCSRNSRRSALSGDSQVPAWWWRRRRHSLDSTRSLGAPACLADSEAVAAAALLGIRGRRARRRALVDHRRHSHRRPHSRRSSQLTLSRRSSTVSRASSSLTSQLAHALDCANRSRIGGVGLWPRPARRRTGGGPRAGHLDIGTAPVVDKVSSSHTEQERNDHVNSQHAGNTRSPAGSSCGRASAGPGSNVSSGSSVLNLAQRLRGDIAQLARRTRSHRTDAPHRSIELTRMTVGVAGDDVTQMGVASDNTTRVGVVCDDVGRVGGDTSSPDVLRDVANTRPLSHSHARHARALSPRDDKHSPAGGPENVHVDRTCASPRRSMRSRHSALTPELV